MQCHCQSGYLGMTCDQRQKPCNDNPCENRGQCVEKNGGYECRSVRENKMPLGSIFN